MNKNEFVAAVAQASGLDKSAANKAVEAMVQVITNELKSGGDIRIVGFGNFSVSKRAASTGRNPQTGASVNIPERTVPKFTPGKGLRESVNG
jgi:DNA-binding protein HU-beta